VGAGLGPLLARTATARSRIAPALAVAALLASLPAGVWAAGSGASAAAESDRRGGDVLDPLEGARRLRERSPNIAPAAPRASTITRDEGSIAVLEHDGSNYDLYLPDGSPNYEARARVAHQFYATHGDRYDFLLVFTNFEFASPGALAFFSPVRNDVQGLGIPLFDNGDLFGSPGRLRGYVDMAALNRYRNPTGIPPLSLTPGDPGFRRTLGVIAHEVGHNWLTHVRYRPLGGEPSANLLGRGGSHWSTLLDSDASVMDGVDWVPNTDGTFTAARLFDTYSDLDLYLMGLRDPARVPPVTLLRNPAIDPTVQPAEGAVISAQPETVSIDQVLSVQGPRAPDHLASPKAFRIGMILLTAPGVEPSVEDLEAVERTRAAFASHFFELTRGVATADLSLAEEAPPGPAPEADLGRALAWLLAQQGPDGRFEDSPLTALRDSSAVVRTLRALNVRGVPYDRALAWIAGGQPANLDFVSRRALALAGEPVATGLAEGILAHQNVDGGFGPALGYESDAFDTALALRALKALGQPLDGRVRRGVGALGPLRCDGSGWPAVSGGDMSTVVTAEAVLALQDWSAAAEAGPLAGPGLQALLSRRQPDGGFGEGVPTPHATALALAALLRGGGPPEVATGAAGWLQRAQLENGSWAGSRYETALVIGVLREGLGANLVVPADGLTVEPATPDEGDTVEVRARVRNVGRSAAAASRARLYDGAPSPETQVAEVTVPPLEPSDSAEVAFTFPTAERPGPRTLYVVADAADEVRESREDDNAMLRVVVVHGALPDLAVDASAIDVAPDPAEEGETAQVTVTVRNVGQRAAPASLVRLVRGDPRLGGVVIGQGMAPALSPGAAAAVTFPWNTTGLR
jgi:hypothetical protein